MTPAITVALALVLGALAERLRGGWPPMGAAGSDNGAGIARAVRSTIFALCISEFGVPWYIAAMCFVTLWAGVCIGSHRDCWRVQNSEQLLDMLMLGMSRGVLGLLPLFMWAGLDHALIIPSSMMVALPVSHAACYGLAARLDPHLPRIGGMLDNWNAYAELAWGVCLIGASLLMAGGHTYA